jgi:hypothetical protein
MHGLAAISHSKISSYGPTKNPDKPFHDNIF